MTVPDPAAAGGAVAARATERPVERQQVERPSEPAGVRPARWDVATLCGETGEAILVHKGEDYRLRITARGRLILTK